MPEIITLDMNTASIQYLCAHDKRLAKVISMVGPITYSPHEDDPYRFLIHEIIEQMLSVKAGQKIFSRLEELCAGNVDPDNISALTDEQIRSTRTSNAKVEYIRNLTNALESGTLSFDNLNVMSDKDVIREMTKIREIGTWTAKVYLMFVLNRPDILPVEDGAFLQYMVPVPKVDIGKLHLCYRLQMYRHSHHGITNGSIRDFQSTRFISCLFDMRIAFFCFYLLYKA